MSEMQTTTPTVSPARATVDGAWGRLHTRLERGLGHVELLAFQLLSRPLDDAEIAQLVGLAEELGGQLGSLGFDPAASLMRRIGGIFDGDLDHVARGVSVASLLEDVRRAVRLAVDDVLAHAGDGPLVAIVGDLGGRTDELVWVAASRRLAVRRGDVPDDVEAVLVVQEQAGLGPLRPVLRSIAEQHGRVPILLVGAPFDLEDRLRIVDSVDLLLSPETPPADVIGELRRVITAAAAPDTVAVWGDQAIPVAEALADRRLNPTILHDAGDLLEAVTVGQCRSVVILDDDDDALPYRLIGMLRSDPTTRNVPIVRVGDPDRLGGAPMSAALRAGVDAVVGVDTSHDELSMVLRTLLGRHADTRIGAASEVDHAPMAWTTARVVIERMLMAAFRRHGLVGVALIRAPLPEGMSTSIDRSLALDFRTGDVFSRMDQHHLVVALNGTGQATTLRRIESALENRNLGDHARAAVAEFPLHGRSLDELLRRGAAVLEDAEASDGPRAVPVGWRPDGEAGPDVLLVDPDRTLGSILRATLERRGLTVDQEVEAVDALDRLTGFRPDPPPSAVLLELDQLGLDGVQVLRQLREAGVLARIPVVVMSSRASDTDVRLALELGAEDFVPKPLNSALLLHRLHRALHR